MPTLTVSADPAPVGRTIAVWSPDWPVLTAATAAGLDPAAPAAVLAHGAVVACTPSARAAGVRRGHRRREAQYRCPDLVVLVRDLAEEARAFEPVVIAVEAVAPGVEVIRPGLCTVAARGPARYFGGDAPAAARLAAEASAAGPGDRCRAGVAEGAFAAALAARQGQVVPVGGTAQFLAQQPLEVIERPVLVDLLRRLGLCTLGDFGCLPAGDVTARFGAEGAYFHRLVRGLDPRPPDARAPTPDLVVETQLDPPASSVEQAAFAARPLADALHRKLAAAGLGCTRVSVEAATEHGQRHTRVWRHEGVLGPDAIAERVRWQLDGWLSGRDVAARPRSGIAVLRLIPEEVVPHAGEQLGFWATSAADAEAEQRAGRALARVQGLLGRPGVLTAVVVGGRGPGERIRYVPWGDPRDPAPRDGPWPGRLPEPSPAVVPPIPVQVRLCDAAGVRVSVTDRYAVSAPPVRLVIGGDRPRTVVSWAGPWPVEERWWEHRAAARLRVRFQVATSDGAGWLLVLEDHEWAVEAVYD